MTNEHGLAPIRLDPSIMGAGSLAMVDAKGRRCAGTLRAARSGIRVIEPLARESLKVARSPNAGQGEACENQASLGRIGAAGDLVGMRRQRGAGERLWHTRPDRSNGAAGPDSPDGRDGRYRDHCVDRLDRTDGPESLRVTRRGHGRRQPPVLLALARRNRTRPNATRATASSVRPTTGNPVNARPAPVPPAPVAKPSPRPVPYIKGLLPLGSPT